LQHLPQRQRPETTTTLKFIERNWHLRPLTMRSRDNFPNPIADFDDPYVPLNSPAIGDLFDLFNFGRGEGGGSHQ
jgi:phospholipase C